jgi:hypothetical protein
MGLALAFALATAAHVQSQPGTVLWTYDLNAPATTPAVWTNGTAYIGSRNGLYAITNSGSTAGVKWICPAPAEFPASIAGDGTIYFGDADWGANLHALNPDGTTKWLLPLDPTAGYHSFQSAPLIGYDGNIYVVAIGRLYSISATGAKNWQYLFDDTTTRYQHSPVMAPDGTIYTLCFAERSLYAFKPEGTLKWPGSGPPMFCESPAIGSDGTIYVGAGTLLAVRPDATTVWAATETDAQLSSPAIGKDGTIYVGAFDFGLSAFKPDGKLKWHVLSSPQLQQPFRNTPTIDSAGNIYHNTSNTLWCLNPDGQVEWAVCGTPPDAYMIASTAAPVIGSDGTIYAFLNYKLYAIAGTNALADSPWPMYRGNARLTGKKEGPVFQKPRKLPDGNFQAELYNDLGNANTIQTSTDLGSWTSLTNIVITNVPMDFIDLTATNSPTRFYRAIQQ